MEKNWLIRTEQKQITGPLGKNEIIKIVEEKLLGDEDEICPGNGFWIFIRESDLLCLYLYGDAIAPFNPISEAASIVTTEQYTPLVIKKKKKSKKLKNQSESPCPESNSQPKISTSVIILPTEEIIKIRQEAEEIFSYILDENLRENYIQTYIKNRTKTD